MGLRIFLKLHEVIRPEVVEKGVSLIIHRCQKCGVNYACNFGWREFENATYCERPYDCGNCYANFNGY